jgi:hypothetical protein
MSSTGKTAEPPSSAIASPNGGAAADAGAAVEPADAEEADAQ